MLAETRERQLAELKRRLAQLGVPQGRIYSAGIEQAGAGQPSRWRWFMRMNCRHMIGGWAAVSTLLKCPNLGLVVLPGGDMALQCACPAGHGCRRKAKP